MQPHNGAMAGRPCTICSQVNRLEIERALESGESLRAVAARFGISASSLHRHRTSHLRMAVPQPIEADLRQEQPAQNQDVPAGGPVVSTSPPPIPDTPEPEWPNGLTTLAERPEPEAPAQPPVAQERPALQKYNGGRLEPCPDCLSNSWRLLEDGRVSCVVCHRLPPSPGGLVPAGPTSSKESRTATSMITNSAPSMRIRVPIALSSL
jgi:hypothetical protein